MKELELKKENLALAKSLCHGKGGDCWLYEIVDIKTGKGFGSFLDYSVAVDRLVSAEEIAGHYKIQGRVAAGRLWGFICLCVSIVLFIAGFLISRS